MSVPKWPTVFPGLAELVDNWNSIDVATADAPAGDDTPRTGKLQQRAEQEGRVDRMAMRD